MKTALIIISLAAVIGLAIALPPAKTIPPGWSVSRITSTEVDRACRIYTGVSDCIKKAGGCNLTSPWNTEDACNAKAFLHCGQDLMMLAHKTRGEHRPADDFDVRVKSLQFSACFHSQGGNFPPHPEWWEHLDG
jgi:hypothetical protein